MKGLCSFCLLTLFVSLNEAQHSRGFFGPGSHSETSNRNRNLVTKFQRQDGLVTNAFQQQYTPSHILRNPPSFSHSQKNQQPFLSKFHNGFISGNPRFNNPTSSHRAQAPFSTDQRFSSQIQLHQKAALHLPLPPLGSTLNSNAFNNHSNVHVLSQGSLKNKDDIPVTFVQPGSHFNSNAQRPQPRPLNHDSAQNVVSLNSHSFPIRNIPSKAHIEGNKELSNNLGASQFRQTSDVANVNTIHLKTLQSQPFRNGGTIHLQSSPKFIEEKQHPELQNQPNIDHGQNLKQFKIQNEDRTEALNPKGKTSSPESDTERLKSLEIVSFSTSKSNVKKSLDSELKTVNNIKKISNEKENGSKKPAFEVDPEEYKAFMAWVKKNRHIMGPGATTTTPNLISISTSPTTTTTQITPSSTPSTQSTSIRPSTFKTIHLNVTPSKSSSTTTTTATTTTTLPPTTSTPIVTESTTSSTASLTTKTSSFRPKFRNLKRIRNFNAKFRPKPTKYFQRYREQKLASKTTTPNVHDDGISSTTPKPKYFVINSSKRISKWRPQKNKSPKLRIHRNREGQIAQREKVVKLLTSAERKPFSFKMSNSSTELINSSSSINDTIPSSSLSPMVLEDIKTTVENDTIVSPYPSNRSIMIDSTPSIIFEEIIEVSTFFPETTQSSFKSTTINSTMEQFEIVESVETFSTVQPTTVKHETTSFESLKEDFTTEEIAIVSNETLIESFTEEIPTEHQSTTQLIPSLLGNIHNSSTTVMKSIEVVTNTTPSETSTSNPVVLTDISLPESSRRSENEFPDFLKNAVPMIDSFNLTDIKVTRNSGMNVSGSYAKSVVYS